MRASAQFVLLLLALLLSAAQAEVVDRSIAVVNRHVITWSDLNEEMRFEALENERPLAGLTAADRQQAFEHLVQAIILRDQMAQQQPADAGAVDARIAELRTQWHQQGDDVAWAATLRRYGLTSGELRILAAEQIEVFRYLEFRVRPLVRVTRREVEDYYSITLAPQLMARGQAPESLSEVSQKIRELLTEQKFTSETEKLLAGLRAQSSVRLLWDGVR